MVEKSGFPVGLIQDSNDVLHALHPRPTLDVIPLLGLASAFSSCLWKGKREVIPYDS